MLIESATPKHNAYFEFSNVLAGIHFVVVQKSSNIDLDMFAISDWKHMHAHGSKYISQNAGLHNQLTACGSAELCLLSVCIELFEMSRYK